MIDPVGKDRRAEYIYPDMRDAIRAHLTLMDNYVSELVSP